MNINRLLKFFSKPSNPQPTPTPTPTPTPAPTPCTELEEKQQLLAHHVRLVARRRSNGLFIFSRGGLGKSRIVLQTLADEGVRPIILTAHVTPLALYQAMYANQDAVFFLDDCETLFSSPVGLGLLRSALWGENQDRRLVTYTSSQLDIPSSFEFSGAVIFAANQYPKRSPQFQAVLSRIDVVHIRANNSDVIELMKRLSVDGFDGLSATDCLECVNYIEGFGATRQLSLRLLIPSFQKMLYAREVGIDWRDLVKSQLEQIEDDDSEPADNQTFERVAMEQAIAAHPGSVRDQQDKWCKATGKGRASFFRLKKTFEQKSESPQPPTDLPPPSHNTN